MNTSWLSALTKIVCALAFAASVSHVAATASVSTLASASLSADTAATGTYTALTSPVLSEGANRDVGTGTIILNAPAGFEFSTTNAVTAIVTKIAGSGGSGAALTLSSTNATVTASTITLTVSAQDGTGGGTPARSSITWVGLRVRPTAGTNIIGNITKTGTSAITGITASSTSFGLLTEFPGAVTAINFLQQPPSTNAGAIFSPAVSLQLKDQFGLLCTNNSNTNVTLALGANPGSGTLSGTLTRPATAGLVTFTNLSVNRPGLGYDLIASAGALTTTSTTFEIVVGAAAKLGIVQQPTSAVAGTLISPDITVEVQDAGGNLITGSSANIAVALGANPGGSVLTTTTPVAAVNGVATFTNVSLNKVGTNYTLNFTSTGLASTASSNFNITAAAAALVRVETLANGTGIVPTTNIISGTSRTFFAIARDANSNFVANVAADAWSLVNLTGGVDATNLVAATGNSNAVFTGFLTGTAQMHVDVASLTSTDSGTVTVAANTPNKIIYTTAPQTFTAGSVSAPIGIQLQDASGNIANTTSNRTVTLSTTPTGGTFRNPADSATITTIVLATGQSATNYLYRDTLATNRVLNAASTGFTTATQAVTTVVGALTKFALATVGTQTAGVPFNISITAQDTNGNTITTFTDTVDLATTAGVITPTTSGNFVNGALTQSVTVTSAGTNKTITATNATQLGTSAASAGFTVNSGTPTQIQFLQQPSSTTAGIALAPAVTVEVRDSFSNLLTLATNVTLAFDTNPSSATLSGTLTRATVNGIATFTNLSVNLPGVGYTLSASAAGLPLVISSNFDIAVGPSAKLIITQQPTSTIAATVITPALTVQVTDAGNNFITNATDSVTVALGASPAGSVLSGTLTVAAADGIATFSDLSLNKAGTSTLVFSASGLTSTTSSNFVISAGAATVVRVETLANGNGVIPATNVIAGNSLTLHAIARDANSNFVANVAADAWSLVNLTGGANATNLVANGGNSNATFTARLTGTAQVHADVSGLTSVDSGTLTVVRGAPSKMAFITAPQTNVAGSISSTFTVQIQDAGGNPTNAIALRTVTLTNAPAGGTIRNAADSATIASVVIAIGQNSTNFLYRDLVATNRNLLAVSTGLTTATQAVVTIAGGLSKFALATVGTQTAGVPFNISLTAQDTNGNLVASFNDTANLTTTAGTITPTVSGNFTNGVLVQNVTVTGAGAGKTITATNAAQVGASAASAGFTVLPSTTTHYLISASPTQSVTIPFAVAVTAKDIYENSVTTVSNMTLTFTGTGAAQFDANADDTFGDNTKTLTAGALSFNVRDDIEEEITVTATDTNGIFASTNLVVGPAIGSYRSVTSGLWNSAANWETNNGATWDAALTPPTNNLTASLITVRSGNTLTNTTSLSLDQTTIETGATVVVSNTVTVTVVSGLGIDLNVNGTIRNLGTFTNSSATIRMNSGALYQHAINGGVIPTATWNSNSTCEVSGSVATLPTGIGQTFSHLIWSSTGETGNNTLGSLLNVTGNLTISATGAGHLQLASGVNTVGKNYSQTGGFVRVGGGSDRTLTIGGNFSMSGGTIEMADSTSAGRVNVAGNFSHTGGTIQKSSTGITLITFNGTTPQTYTSGGTVTGSVSYTVTNGATLFLGTSVITGTGNFTNASGATLGVGSPAGLTATGATGNLQNTGTRLLNAGASYIYNGATAQVIGAGLTSCANLTISNAAGVKLSGNISVSGACSVAASGLLLGTNNIVGRVVVDGAIAPGASVGKLTTGRETWNSGGSYNFEISNAAGTPGVDYDLLALTSGNGIDLLATSGSKFTVKVISATTGTTNFDNASTNVWLIAALTNATVTNFSADKFTVDASAFTNALNGGTFTVDLLDATNLVVRFSSAPVFAATQLAFVQQPTSAIAGAAITPAVTVRLQDAASNNVAQAGVAIVVALNGSGTLSGTRTNLTDASGVATFSGLSGNLVGSKTLTATATGLTNADSDAFTISHAAASQLAVVTQPATNATAGVAFAQQPVVEVHDAFGNFVSDDNTTVITGARGAGAGVLQGALDQTATNGMITFTNLAHNVATNITVTFSSGSLTGATSLVITIAPNTVTSLAFTTQPAGAALFTPFATQPVVSTVDAFGNASTLGLATNLAVSVTLNTGTLLGTTNFDIGSLANNGVVTFTNLQIDATGTNYQLTASATDLTNAVSTVFVVNKATAVVTLTNLAQNYSGTARSVTVATTPGALTYTLTYAGAATAPTNAGNYEVIALVNELNYQGGATNTLVVSPIALTVTAANAAKNYNGLAYAGGNGVSYVGFVNGETNTALGGTLGYTGTSQGAVNAGAYVLTPGGLTSSNYTIAFMNGALTVNQVPLLVAPLNATRAYGAANPAFTPSYTGFVNSENSGVLGGTPTLTTAATTNSAVGTYPIVAALGSLTATNYNLGFTNATLTVTKTPLAVLANNDTKTYDTSAYTGGNGVSYTGFVNGENSSALGGTLGYTGTSQGAVNAGNYALTPGGLTSGNYSLTFSNGTLAVTKALLFVMADDQSRAYGAANPFFSVNYDGFVGGEGLEVLSGFPTTTCTASNTSPAGTYPIVVAQNSLAAANYAFVLINGQLTVTPASSTITSITALPNGDATLTFLGTPGATYRVQANDNLSTTNWVTLGSVTAATNGGFNYTDTDGHNHTLRFYRDVTP